MKKMLIIGVSGQTGAGKSTLANMLSCEGLGINLEVDAIGHQLLNEPSTVKKLVEKFGPEILDEKGGVCRRSLGHKAFLNEESIEDLNSVMHPAMVERVQQQIEKARRNGDEYFIVNAALLFSMHLDSFCNRLVYVMTSPEIRFQRLVDYRNWTEESAKARLFAQDEIPAGRSDIIMVNNDGTEEELAVEARRVAQLLKGNE